VSLLPHSQGDFINYFNYAATAVKGYDGESLLQQAVGAPRTLDCASLATALKLLLNEYLHNDEATVEQIGHADGFATKAGSKCFNTKVSGNIRQPSKDLADTSRCVFKSHYFVRSGNSAQLLLDPCLFKTYSTTGEVKDWLLEPGYAPFDRMRKIQGHPDKFLVMVPSAENKNLKAQGFRKVMCSSIFIYSPPPYEQRMFYGFKVSGLSLHEDNSRCESTLKRYTCY
jgi:hypothetical protein